MENSKASAKKVMINYGVILAVLNILVGVVLYATNNHIPPSAAAQWGMFLVNVVVIIMAIRTYKKENGGFLKLSQALKTGVGTALVFALIYAIWQVVFVTIIEPDFMAQMAEVQRELALESNPDLTEAQLDQMASFTEMFSKPWVTVVVTLAWYLFIGFIVSLIAGLVMKKENPYEGV